jgi:hypothetical protein
MKQQYPEDAIESLNKYFPKGHKDRGKVMMILSIAFAEGRKAQKEKGDAE